MNASRTCAWIATAVLGLACGGGSSEPEPVPPLTIGTASLPGGTVGTPYTAALTASGGTAPYQWSLASGSLPSGLDLGGGGVISGTPTAAGTSSFTVRVTTLLPLREPRRGPCPSPLRRPP